MLGHVYFMKQPASKSIEAQKLLCLDRSKELGSSDIAIAELDRQLADIKEKQITILGKRKLRVQQ